MLIVVSKDELMLCFYLLFKCMLNLILTQYSPAICALDVTAKVVENDWIIMIILHVFVAKKFIGFVKISTKSY